MSRLRINGRGQRWIAGLLVLTLAVLTPVSCLIHCALMDARRQASQIAFFLCDHGDPGAMQAMDHAAAPLPRAFYELLSSPATALPLVLTLVFCLVPRPAPLPALLRFRPPTPPPR